MGATLAISSPAIDPDAALLARIRAGDERAFVQLVDRYSRSLLRIARLYVPSEAVAQEVLQDTWIGVIRGVDRFEGRSTLKTWLARIVTNRAKTQGARERRSVPFSVLAARETDEAFEVDRRASPDPSPEDLAASAETLERVRMAIDALPPVQRLVITMRDVEGWESGEVCNVLGLSETNQRVLLHRARTRVRGALADHLADARI